MYNYSHICCILTDTVSQFFALSEKFKHPCKMKLFVSTMCNDFLTLVTTSPFHFKKCINNDADVCPHTV